ncbi:hypothetical protein PFISCL1PPCAC_4702, partial [Pristionchus fissidentatus]
TVEVKTEAVEDTVVEENEAIDLNEEKKGTKSEESDGVDELVVPQSVGAKCDLVDSNLDMSDQEEEEETEEQVIEVVRKKRGRHFMSDEEKAARKRSRQQLFGQGEEVGKTKAKRNEKKEGEGIKKKRGRPSFKDVEEREKRLIEQQTTVTVEMKTEVVKDTVVEENEAIDWNHERKEEMNSQENGGEDELDTTALDAAIAQAEANAALERQRPTMPVLEKREEKGEEGNEETKDRKRVRFAPLPAKHHARRMPAKRKRTDKDEGQAMRTKKDISSLFSSFDAPSSSRSISSPDRTGRRASIIGAMRARASQLEQQEEHDTMDMVEDAMEEINLPIRAISYESPVKAPIDEFESDEEAVTVSSPSMLPSTMTLEKEVVRKTPTKTTVSPPTTVPREGAAPAKRQRAPPKTKKTAATPVKVTKESQRQAKAAAVAARRKAMAKGMRLRRLKRGLAKKLDKSADRWNLAARSMVEEEDRYWRTSTEVAPLEQLLSCGERLLSWPEIHNTRRNMAIEVEPRREEGEKKPESLHSGSSSVYLARAIDLKKASKDDGLAKIVKSFHRPRSPPIDWTYEEAETAEVARPTVPSLIVPGCALLCL